MPPSSSDDRARERRRAPSRSTRSIVHARDSGACARHRASTSSSWSARRAQMPTVAPRRANPSASAAPMPADAPVTNTCLPFRSYVTGVTLASARRCRSRPTPCCSPAASRSSPAPRRASAPRSRPRSPRFGADVAICDRDADGLARTAAADRRRRPRTRTPSCSTCATATRCAPGSSRSTASTCSSTTRAAASTPRSST